MLYTDPATWIKDTKIMYEKSFTLTCYVVVLLEGYRELGESAAAVHEKDLPKANFDQ